MIKNGIYRHFKGGTVLVFSTSNYSENDTILVNYLGLQNNKIYSRPIDSFSDNVNIDGIIKPRFSLEKELNINITEFLLNYLERSKNI